MDPISIRGLVVGLRDVGRVDPSVELRITTGDVASLVRAGAFGAIVAVTYPAERGIEAIAEDRAAWIDAVLDLVSRRAPTSHVRAALESIVDGRDPRGAGRP